MKIFPRSFNHFIVTVIFTSLLVACGTPQGVDPSNLTAPAISVQITKDYCPSVEVQVGMQIAWTNRDVVDRVLLIERTDGQTVPVDSGGTDLLQPGSTFSITLTEPGQYTYYCSKDHTAFGTISVSP